MGHDISICLSTLHDFPNQTPTGKKGFKPQPRIGNIRPMTCVIKETEIFV